MSEKINTPGERLKHYRTRVLGITQEELAKRLGVTRTLVPQMEKGALRVSNKTAEKMHDVFGVSIAWLMHGIDDKSDLENQLPLVRESLNKSDSYRALPVSTDRLQDILVGRIDGAKYIGQMIRQCCKKDAAMHSRFGYLGLTEHEIRLRAAREKNLEATTLQHIALNDNLWIMSGAPSSWEFELMRGYVEFSGDRELPEWMEFLRAIRWVRTCLEIATDSNEEVDI